MKALISFLVAVSLCLSARAVTLQAAEWFIDSDPGEGSGTAFTGFSGGMASLNLTIPAGTINALNEGVHLLGVRFQDGDGLENIIEQLAGLNPREWSPPGEATGLVQATSGLQFRFRSAAEAAFDTGASTFQLGGLRAALEVTTDFSEWTKATAPEDFAVSTESAAGDEGSFLHAVDLVTSGREKRFYRLKVDRE